MDYEIVPSIIAESEEELHKQISLMKRFASSVQLDVFDSKKYENRSFDFDFILPKGLKYELDLYSDDPTSWIRDNGKKFDTIIVHLTEWDDVLGIIHLIKTLGKKAGIALDPEQEIADFEKYIPAFDMILIMTGEPGGYGAKFDDEMLHKIRESREKWPDKNIEVDVGINADTIIMAKEAGANRFVSGSYIHNSEEPEEGFNNLKRIVKD